MSQASGLTTREQLVLRLLNTGAAEEDIERYRACGIEVLCV
jgi:DNA-binding NarL/FixJ family response regulator